MNRIFSIDAFRQSNYLPGNIYTIKDQITGKLSRWKIIGKGIPVPGKHYITYISGDVVCQAVHIIPAKKMLVERVR
jgi:hypothetical protein